MAKKLAACFLLLAAAAACGGSVDAEPPPPECPAYLHTFRFSEPTLDPTGTSEETATRCITPDGTPAVFSEVWCCQ